MKQDVSSSHDEAVQILDVHATEDQGHNDSDNDSDANISGYDGDISESDGDMNDTNESDSDMNDTNESE